MLFPTFDFAIFFLGLFTLAALLDRFWTARKLVLLLGSWLFHFTWFFGVGMPWLGLLLIGSSAVNHLYALQIEANLRRDGRERANKALVTQAVILNLCVLALFKYYGFLVGETNDLLQQIGWQAELPLLNLILPIGISFYTFQGISYVVDVWRGKARPARAPLDALLLVAFFPHQVAGPIVRAADFLPQLEAAPPRAEIPFARGMLMVLIGLFKKLVVATWLATELVDPVFTDPSAYGAPDLILAGIGFAFQIYCDFSGYTDIAIGLALLFGFKFPQNFNQPYRAQSLQDFWRRWHISLSSWLRDYLYIPLGGSRGGSWLTARNLIVTMALGGLWHGANWTFLIWGLMHGIGLVVERWVRAPADPRRLIPPPFWQRAGWAVAVFAFVTMAWVFFRAPSLELAGQYFAGLARWDIGPSLLTPWIALMLLLGWGFHAGPTLALPRLELWAARLPVIVLALLGAAAIVAIDALGSETVAPFIYFQF